MNAQYKKGVIELCVLSVLQRRDCYGYEIAALEQNRHSGRHGISRFEKTQKGRNAHDLSFRIERRPAQKILFLNIGRSGGVSKRQS